jgi:hypothetical protein
VTIRGVTSGEKPGGAGSDAAGRTSGGVVSLEVRWIHPGRLPALLLERLEPFEAGIEVREDLYLVDPVLPDVSVKIRGGVQLDVKAFRHSPGRLSLPGGTRGRLELWERWSFPLAAVPQPLVAAADWTRVEKRRRRRSFAPADDGLVERPRANAVSRGCSLEVTEVSIDGAVWWTLGLEAVGPLDTLHRDLHAAAVTLIDDRLSARFGLHSRASMSYFQRLQTQPRRPEHGDRRGAKPSGHPEEER